jgi:hypothetical protein
VKEIASDPIWNYNSETSTHTSLAYFEFLEMLTDALVWRLLLGSMAPIPLSPDPLYAFLQTRLYRLSAPPPSSAFFVKPDEELLSFPTRDKRN